jgi:hypothetical protein
MKNSCFRRSRILPTRAKPIQTASILAIHAHDFALNTNR